MKLGDLSPTARAQVEQALAKQDAERAKASAPKRSAPAKQRRMNDTEAAYARLLDTRVRLGEVASWDFEAITLRLGFDLRYTPDFAVWLPDGSLEFHETKGFMRDDARVKLFAAASKFDGRHKFYLARTKSRRNGEFEVTELRT